MLTGKVIGDNLQLKKILLTSLGFVFLGLGAIGLFLPVWPTTPFVLLSAACFSSSPRIKSRIMKISFFREHIENYERREGLSKKTVWISIIWLWGMLFISFTMIKKLWIIIFLIFVGTAVTTHILWISRPKGKKKDF